MPNDGSWADRVVDAAKDAWLGVEASAIIASSPAGVMQDNNIQFTDPVMGAGITALSESQEMLSSLVEGRAEAEEVAEVTDVVQEPETSLIVDPPSWMSDPSEFEASVTDDLASWTGDHGSADFEGDVGGSFL